MNSKYSTRELVRESVIAELRSEASKFRTSNYYGYVTSDGRTLSRQNYVCYAYLSSAGTSIPAIYGGAVYSASTDWPVEEQNLYFEYALDPVRSPWRQLLAVLDYEVCRDSRGIITGLIIFSTKVNRYILMQFMKMLRQIIERQGGIKVFTDSVKGRYEPGTKKEYTEAQEEFMLNSFIMSQMFAGSGGSVYLDWGGEHKNFHGMPSSNMFSREIKDFDKNIDKTTFYSSSAFQSGTSLHSYAFGQRGHDHATDLQGYVPVIDGLIKQKKSTEVQIVGNLFTKPTPLAPSGGGTKYFKLQDILALVPTIARDLRSRA